MAMPVYAKPFKPRKGPAPPPPPEITPVYDRLNRLNQDQTQGKILRRHSSYTVRPETDNILGGHGIYREPWSSSLHSNASRASVKQPSQKNEVKESLVSKPDSSSGSKQRPNSGQSLTKKKTDGNYLSPSVVDVDDTDYKKIDLSVDIVDLEERTSKVSDDSKRSHKIKSRNSQRSEASRRSDASTRSSAMDGLSRRRFPVGALDFKDTNDMVRELSQLKVPDLTERFVKALRDHFRAEEDFIKTCAKDGILVTEDSDLENPLPKHTAIGGLRVHGVPQNYVSYDEYDPDILEKYGQLERKSMREEMANEAATLRRKAANMMWTVENIERMIDPNSRVRYVRKESF